MTVYQPGTSSGPASPDGATQPAASRPPAPELGTPGPDLAERLAYSIDEAVRLAGLSRDPLYDQMHCGDLA
jgi:hypothetical protein